MAERETDRDPPKVVHLLKICVGVDQVEQLELWQGQRVARGEQLRHVTRNRPRRENLDEGGYDLAKADTEGGLDHDGVASPDIGLEPVGEFLGAFAIDHLALGPHLLREMAHLLACEADDVRIRLDDRRLQVAMNESGPMRLMYRQDDVFHEHDLLVDRHRCACRHEIAAVYILHGNIRLSCHFADFVDSTYVVVLDQSLFRGQVTLLNVWGTWCPACKDEHDDLMWLAEEKGVNIIGLNYKDNREDAQLWLDRLGDPYRKIIYDPRGTLGFDLGVYGAPETFVIDAEGVVRYRHVGVVNKAVWEQTLLPVFNDAQGNG